MKTTTVRALGLSILLSAFASVPALADNGGLGGGGRADFGGSGSGDYGGGGGGDGGGGGGSHGTPAPIAGLGLLALGAIRYGSKKLRKEKSGKSE